MIIKNGLQHNTDKGFTLVELIVVLVLMSIILSVAAFGILGWIDWASFHKENDAAEDIFYAAQNQLTELDSSGAMKRRVENVLKGSNGKYVDKYVLAQGTKTETRKDDFTGILDSDSQPYAWEDLWIDTNAEKEVRTLIRLVADAGEYTEYSKDPSAYASEAESDKIGTKLLFELIAPYIADKSVLNGAIALEFSPESGQVFSVCYSDRYSTFSDDDIKDRTLSLRESNMLGYFSVDTLTSKIRGRDRDESGYLLQIDNGNCLDLQLGMIKNVATGVIDKDIYYTIQGSQQYNNDHYTDIMSFKLSTDAIDPNATSFQSGAQHPVATEITFKSGTGLYPAGAKIKFYLPVWREAGRIHIALDAADIQAQSVTYAGANGLLEETFVNPAVTTDPDVLSYQQAFRNTYSFYRFGLYNTRYIRATAVIANKGENSGPTVNAGRLNETEEYSDEDGKIHGEAVTFANFEEGDAENTYGIKNGRHLYNVRFETDYGESYRNSIPYNAFSRAFVLKSEVNWDDFVAGEKGNCLVNSCERVGIVDDSCGINLYAGAEKPYVMSGYTDEAHPGFLDTAKVPFPGFRMLTYGDSFTQNKDLGNLNEGDDYYRISNLNISFSANCIYGIYGEEIQDKIANNNSYSNVSGLGKAGYLPLGLFAQNLGTISDIELDNIKVSGIELFTQNATDPYLFTSKVGGFVGENFGTVEDLFIDDYNSVNYGKTEKYNSHIRGRSDIGGIVGHQYLVAMGSGDAGNADSLNAKLNRCRNNAKVTGIGYVGGIIGRIYPGAMAQYDISASGYGLTTADGISESDLASMYSDNYIPVDETSYELKPVESFAIQNCKNHGEVYMDPYFIQYRIDGELLKLKRGFYYGGITGAALYNYNTDRAPAADAAYFNNNYASKVSIVNCESYTVYSKAELENIIYDMNGTESVSDQVLDSRSRLRSNFVGGITGCARYAVIDKCSTTPDQSLYKDGPKYSFVIGDRYVGGVVGASVQTRFIGDSAYNNQELTKVTGTGDISNVSTGYRRNYSIINGTGVLGNYAVGGVAGSFGIPNYSGEREFYGGNVELAYQYNIEYPVNAGQIINSPYSAVGLLNTSVVLGYSFNSKLNTSNNSANLSGLNNYGLGGITGLLSATINNADYIQTEATKLLNLQLLCIGTSYADPQSVTGFFEEGRYNTTSGLEGAEINDNTRNNINKLTTLISQTQFVTDGVGGIAGQGIGAANINKKDSSYYNSKVDAIVFGRNRVGGGIGDTATIEDKSGMTSVANVVPSKVNSGSSGMYVFGYDCVGGLVGAYKDYADQNNRPGLNRAEDYNASYGKFTVGFHVLGYRAVGGLVGIVVDNPVGDSYAPKMICANFGSPRTDYIKVVGSLYVGGVVGIQEGYSNDENIESRYYVKMTNVKVKAECFGACIAGAIYCDEYFPLNKLMYCDGESKITGDNGKTNEKEDIKCVDVYVKQAGAFVTGLYAYNGNKGKTKSGREDDSSVLYNNTTASDINNNYTAEIIENVKLSRNGLVSISEINDYKFNSNLLTNYNTIKDVFNDVPSSHVQMKMNLHDLSNLIQSGGGDETHATRYHNRIWADIFAGGLFGYVPDYTYLEIEDYRNRAAIKARSYIYSNEDGNGDVTKFSYLGSVTGRVPKGMTLNNCSNSSPDKDYNSYQHSNKSDYATYKGGMTEVNAGCIINSLVIYNMTDGDIDKYLKVTPMNGSEGIGGLVGINGTTTTRGMNTGSDPYEGVIKDCKNIERRNKDGDVVKVPEIKGSVAGGIAAVSGGKSVIIGCINASKVQGANNGIAGGMLGSVISDQSGVTIENCVNYGSVASLDAKGNANGVYSAGIVYNANGVADIICCRNYNDTPKYAIVSSVYTETTNETANSVKFCFDASNITNAVTGDDDDVGRTTFGTITDVTPSDKMYANFYKGVKMTSDFHKNSGFEAYKSYSDQISDAGYNVLENSRDKISGKENETLHGKGVLSADKTDYDRDLLFGLNNDSMLTYEVFAVTDDTSTTDVNTDGICNNVYANIDKLEITREKGKHNGNGSASEDTEEADSEDTEEADSEDTEAEYSEYNEYDANGDPLKELQYNVFFFDVFGNYIRLSGISEEDSSQLLSIEFDLEAINRAIPEGSSSNNLTGITGIDNVTYDAYKSVGFDKDMISKVVVMITSSGGYGAIKAGIRAFYWTEAGTTTGSVAMPRAGFDTITDSLDYAGSTSGYSNITLDIITTRLISLRRLYFEDQADPNKKDLVLNDDTKVITDLTSDTIAYSKTVDDQYMTFIKPLYDPNPSL